MPAQFIQTLINNDAVLVHCCSESQLVGGPNTIHLSPLEKLRVAITGDHVIACSTVQPGDTMVCPNTNHIKNYTGPLGIILSPKIHCSITQAHSTDSGSTPLIRESSRNNSVCTQQELNNAIVNRVNYNEIFVHTYKVIGIFLCPPLYLMVKHIKLSSQRQKFIRRFQGMTSIY